MRLFCLPVFLCGFASSLPAAAISIDGDLSDWLAASPTGTASDWTPRAGIASTVEDQKDNYLNPGYGWQYYDAEAFYATYEGSDLYLAIVTGRAPAESTWEPGDIALDIDGDGIYDYGIVTFAGGLGLGVAGDIYRADDWALGIWTAANQYISDYDHPPQSLSGAGSDYQAAHPTLVTSGTKLGEVELTYTEATYDGSVPAQLGPYANGHHYLIETRVPLDLLGLATAPASLDLHWTMACANDWIQLRVKDPGNPVSSVPLPADWSLLGLGLVVLGGVRARRQVASHAK